MTGKKKTGRPVKVSGGLTRVLYMRIQPELLAGLDGLVESRQQKKPWLVISRADIVRELIHQAIERKKQES